MRVHSQGWLKDVSRIQATSEIERGQDHEQEEPIADTYFSMSIVHPFLDFPCSIELAFSPHAL
jgi:hypothetical protein